MRACELRFVIFCSTVTSTKYISPVFSSSDVVGRCGFRPVYDLISSAGNVCIGPEVVFVSVICYGPSINKGIGIGYRLLSPIGINVSLG